MTLSTRATLSLVAVACAVVGARMHAQTRFSSTTALLTLDVSVLDGDGKPITDLAPGDLTVTLNGQSTPVRTMIYLATQSSSTVAAAPNVLTANVAASPETRREPSHTEPDPRLFVLLIDDESIYPTESKGLFVAAERFVDRLPTRDWLGLATTSARVTVNPTLDRPLLQQKLKRMFGGMNDPRREMKPYLGFLDALMIDAGSPSGLRDAVAKDCRIPANILAAKSIQQILTEYDCASELERQSRYTATWARRSTQGQLDNYRAVIDAMAPAPGVKQLIIVTGGIAMLSTDSHKFIAVAKAAAVAGVQITMLVTAPDPSEAPQLIDGLDFMRDQQFLHQNAQTLAEYSGGQFFSVVGQADRFYDRVLTSASAVYRIGVDVPPNLPPDGQYTVSVKTTRPGVHTFASRYAAPPAPSPLETPADRVAKAVRTGDPAYGVGVQVSAEFVPATAGNAAAIHVSIDAPAATPGPLAGVFGLLGPDGQLKTGHRSLERSQNSAPYHADFLVPATQPGVYRLRYAVADATGAVGAASQSVVVK